MNDPIEGRGGRRTDTRRIGALFNHSWSHEFDSFERGEVPSHRLFGLEELRQRGHDVIHCPHRAGRLDWRLAQTWWLLRHQRHLDVAIATHEAAALPSLVLKRLGLLKLPMIVLTVAATADRHTTGVRGRVLRWALRAADILTVYATCQQGLLSARLRVPVERVRFVPLGADDRFFRPSTAHRERSILSVGTNEGKDFPTLLSAVPEDVPCTIVTDAPNIELCQQHGFGSNVTLRQAVPIAHLREMYASAGVVVFPLREVNFSSGQTVLLENALMRSPMIVSDVSGVRDYVPEATRVPAGDARALAAAINAVLGDGRDSVAYQAVPTASDLGLALAKLVAEVTRMPTFLLEQESR